MSDETFRMVTEAKGFMPGAPLVPAMDDEGQTQPEPLLAELVAAVNAYAEVNRKLLEAMAPLVAIVEAMVRAVPALHGLAKMSATMRAAYDKAR